MAKKKNNSCKKFLTLIGGVLGFVAVVLFAMLPMVKQVIETPYSEGITTSKFAGFGMIFGAKDLTVETIASGHELDILNFKDTFTYEKVNFNTLAFFAFVLVLIGAAIALASVVSKSLSTNKFAKLLAAGLVLIGGILMFSVKSSTMVALDTVKISEYFSLGLGAILGGISAILSGLTIGASALLKK